MKTKICTKCKKKKSLSAFNKCKGGKYGVRGDCKRCCKVVRYKYYNKNKSKICKRGRDYYCKLKENFPEKFKKRQEQAKEKTWKYQGIDCNNKLYNKMFSEQDGCCAVCGKHQSELKRKFDVDHNHITNQIRGLLCSSCNAAIGSLGADSGIELLQKAIKYIKKTDNI